MKLKQLIAVEVCTIFALSFMDRHGETFPISKQNKESAEKSLPQHQPAPQHLLEIQERKGSDAPKDRKGKAKVERLHPKSGKGAPKQHIKARMGWWPMGGFVNTFASPVIGGPFINQFAPAYGPVLPPAAPIYSSSIGVGSYGAACCPLPAPPSVFPPVPAATTFPVASVVGPDFVDYDDY